MSAAAPSSASVLITLLKFYRATWRWNTRVPRPAHSSDWLMTASVIFTMWHICNKYA